MKYILIAILTTVTICFQSTLFGQSVISFQKTYGMTGYNYGRTAFQTGDGGYIILGNKSGFVGNTDIYLVKTDTMGVIQWDKAIGGTEIEWANDFKITHDKGYIIAGYTNVVSGNGYDVLLIKTDSLGNVKWQKTFGGTDWDMGYSVIEDKNQDFLIAGTTYSNSYGDADVYLIKTDSLGDTIWTRHYGGTGSDIAYSIDTTHFSDYLICGVTKKITDTTYDAYLLKISNNGDTLLTKKYGGLYDDKFYCARQIDDTSYIVCGTTKNFGAQNYDQWILKLDTLGNQRWMRVFIHPEGDEELFDIKQSWDHGLATAGYTASFGAGGEDASATIFSTDGWFSEGRNYGGEKNDLVYSINLTKDSGYICTGTSKSFGLGITNIYVIKTDKFLYAPSTSTHETGVVEIDQGQNFSFNIFPNPTNGPITININNNINKNTRLKVINILGIELISENFNTTTVFSNKVIDISGFPDGVYFIQISDDKFSSCVKIIKQSFK